MNRCACGREEERKHYAEYTFLEANGFSAVEIPSGDWPIQNCDAMLKLQARDLRTPGRDLGDQFALDGERGEGT